MPRKTRYEERIGGVRRNLSRAGFRVDCRILAERLLLTLGPSMFSWGPVVAATNPSGAQAGEVEPPPGGGLRGPWNGAGRRGTR